MPAAWSKLVLTVALAALTHLCTSCGPPKDGSLDAIVSTYLRPGGGGLAIAVVRDGRILVKKGYGPASIEQGTVVTPATVFDLASIGKQFTGIALILLAERGKLSMDDDIRKYVPEVPAFDANRPMRIRDLSRHRSGLPEFKPPSKPYTEADILSWVSKVESLEFPPGTAWRYCNLNYVLLARVVERVSGKKLRAFLEDEVFAKAGMRDAQVLDRPDGIVRNRATGYCFGKPCKWDDGVTGPAGVFASLDDMIGWDAALARGEIVQQERILQAVASGYDFGWGWTTHKGRRLMWHDGDSIGASTYIARYVDVPLTVIVLSSQTRLPVEELERKVAELYLR